VARRVIHLVLLVSAEPERLQRRRQVVRDAGYYAVPAHAVDHALVLARKARPSVVIADVDLGDERAFALLQALRELEPLQGVHVILLGVLTPEEQVHLAHDPHARGHPDDDETELVALLHDVLAA